MPTSEAREGEANAEGEGRRSRLAFLFWPLVCLVNVAFIGVAFYLGSRLASRPGTGEADQPEAPRFEMPVAGVRPEPRHPAVRAHLDEADLLIRTGRYELALAVCAPAADRAVARLRDAFRYRKALCLEGLGRWDQALAAYRTVARRSPSSLMACAAQLGQARVWLRRRRPGEGKELLGNLLLRSGEPSLRDHPLVADARYLLALALAREYLESQPADVVEPPLSHTASDWSLERALSWGALPKAGQPAPAVPEPAAETVSVQRVGPGDEEVLVRVAVQEMTVPAVLDRLTERAGLRLEWSAAARGKAEGRTLHIVLGPMPLPDFLRALGTSLGLSWKTGRRRLLLRSEDEETGPDRPTRLVNARRALGEAVLNFPGHPLTPVAYLEMGNLADAAGRPNEALAWYRRIIREWPRSPLVAEAYYNRGLLQRRAGENAAARQTFYRVVDRGPGHELAPLAYWHIGRLYLEDNEPEQALSPLRRALLASRGSPVEPAVVLTMATAYLLADNPRAANRTLVQHRALVGRQGFRRAAAFLDTLARYRACTERLAKRREANDLMTCLLALGDGRSLGAPGMVLMARAYHELGLDEPLIPFARKALVGLRGPLAAELSYVLAEAHLAADQRGPAGELYAAVAGGRGRRATAARLRLAELALQERNAPECLKWCRKLLQEKEGTDPTAVLRLMAGAYELTGERDKAIRCLSGQVPP